MTKYYLKFEEKDLIDLLNHVESATDRMIVLGVLTRNGRQPIRAAIYNYYYYYSYTGKSTKYSEKWLAEIVKDP